jgi:hypothetical protein
MAVYGPVRHQKDKQNKKHTTMRKNESNVNKTLALLHTTKGKDEPNIVLCGNRNGHHNTEQMTTTSPLLKRNNTTSGKTYLHPVFFVVIPLILNILDYYIFQPVK